MKAPIATLLSLLSSCSFVPAIKAQNFYTVDVSNSYSWNRAYPQSCECVENGVASSRCTLFRCICTCDVTAGECDYNCCCDPDCSGAQVDRFQSLGKCSFEGFESDSIKFCYESDDLYSVNPRGELSNAESGGSSTAETALSEALCVQRKNFANEAEYFQRPGLQPSTTIFQQPGGEKEFSFLNNGAGSSSSSASVLPDGVFDQNDTIAAFMDSNISTLGLISNGPGYFPIPARDFSGYCNHQNFAHFEREVKATAAAATAGTSCVEQLSVMTVNDIINVTTNSNADAEGAGVGGGEEVNRFLSKCRRDWSVQRYVDNLWIAKRANLRASNGVASFADVVQVQISEVLFTDFLTGSTIDATETWVQNSCMTTAVGNLSADSTFSPLITALVNVTTNNSMNSSLPAITTTEVVQGNSPCFLSEFETQLSFLPSAQNPFGGVCIGMVQSVRYTVNHTTDAQANIIAVTASVTLTDAPVSLRVSDSTPSSSSSSSSSSTGEEVTGVALGRAFGVAFSSVSGSGISADNGNIVRRERSGNPGYIIGKPVLYGFQSEPASAESGVLDRVVVDGLTVPSSFAPGIAGITTTPTATTTLSRGGSGISGGKCPQIGEVSGQTPIAFGHDLVTGCSMELTRAELVSLCCQGSGGDCINPGLAASAAGLNGVAASAPATSEYADPAGVPYFLNFSAGFVGIYGDADPLDISQWFRIAFSQSTASRSWSDKTSTCKNMLSGLRVQFLVASSGERQNPQNKIVAAAAALTSEDWIMSVPFGDEASAQRFPLTVTVSFVFSGQDELEGYKAPAPPVLFKVPYDVFHPFLQNAATSSGGGDILLGRRRGLVAGIIGIWYQLYAAWAAGSGGTSAYSRLSIHPGHRSLGSEDGAERREETPRNSKGFSHQSDWGSWVDVFAGNVCVVGAPMALVLAVTWLNTLLRDKPIR